VTHDTNPRFRMLIEAFHAMTDVPIVLNTSFNVMGKPMIHSVEDALAMFYTTGLDALVIDDWLIAK
jgi:carbamoyltransferase